MNSDEIVDRLNRYGCVHIYQSDNDKTFSVKASLFTHGCKTEVHSGFRHATMNAALLIVWDKVCKLVTCESNVALIKGKE